MEKVADTVDKSPFGNPETRQEKRDFPHCDASKLLRNSVKSIQEATCSYLDNVLQMGATPP